MAARLAKSLLVVLFLSSCSAAVAIRRMAVATCRRSVTLACSATASAWPGRPGTSATRSARRPPAWAARAAADCFDIDLDGNDADLYSLLKRVDCDAAATDDEQGQPVYKVVHRVTDADNALRAGDPFPGTSSNSTVIDNRPLRGGEGALPRGPVPGARQPGAVAVLDGDAQERQPGHDRGHLPRQRPPGAPVPADLPVPLPRRHGGA
ncbi:Retrovirus-related Pol polyprotein from transposon TNT 1-94 [Hordeum vulgare]|nr:Retrovirus-related Pol polyprotein from transposon TNT 1-94 [Hordeum vulgare]